MRWRAPPNYFILTGGGSFFSYSMIGKRLTTEHSAASTWKHDSAALSTLSASIGRLRDIWRMRLSYCIARCSKKAILVQQVGLTKNLRLLSRIYTILKLTVVCLGLYEVYSCRHWQEKRFVAIVYCLCGTASTDDRWDVLAACFRFVDKILSVNMYSQIKYDDDDDCV